MLSSALWLKLIKQLLRPESMQKTGFERKCMWRRGWTYGCLDGLGHHGQDGDGKRHDQIQDREDQVHLRVQDRDQLTNDQLNNHYTAKHVRIFYSDMVHYRLNASVALPKSGLNTLKYHNSVFEHLFFTRVQQKLKLKILVRKNGGEMNFNDFCLKER